MKTYVYLAGCSRNDRMLIEWHYQELCGQVFVETFDQMDFPFREREAVRRLEKVIKPGDCLWTE